MHSTDNKIRVFEKDGERYVVVNDLLKVIKTKSFAQWVTNQKRNLQTNFFFYDGIYIASQNDAEKIIKHSKSIVKEDKELLLSQLNQVNVPGNLKLKEEEKYEFLFKSDLPFIEKESVEFFMKKRAFV